MENKDNFLTISEFAKLSAIPAPSCWWYARRGVLPTTERYGVKVVARKDIEPFMADYNAMKRFKSAEIDD